MKGATKALSDAVQQVKATVADLRAAITEVERQIRVKERELAALTGAPLPRADLAGAVDEWLDSLAQPATRHLGTLVKMLAERGNDGPRQLLNANLFLGATQQGPIPITLLWALRDPLKEAFRAVLSTADYPDAQVGLPRAERAQAIEKLRSDIQALAHQKAALERQAREAGIALRGAAA